MKTGRWLVMSAVQVAVICLGSWLATEYYLPATTTLKDGWLDGEGSAAFIFTLAGLIAIASVALNCMINGVGEDGWRWQAIAMVLVCVAASSISCVSNIGMPTAMLLAVASFLGIVIIFVVIATIAEAVTANK